jgi:hypothetical protein
MKLSIEIECDNTAFEPSRDNELARILRRLATDFEGGHVNMLPRRLHDVNGNRVGTAEFVELPTDEPLAAAAPSGIDTFTVEDDEEGLSSHKRDQYREDCTPLPEVVLSAEGYRNGALVNSLGDIDFYEDGGDWTRGSFKRVSEIPANCEHLRGIARDMGLPE